MRERDVLEIMALFEQGLQEKLEEQKGEVERIKYYEEFKINEINFAEIFITTEKDAKGNTTYHVYCGDASNEMLAIDSEGKLQVKNHALKRYFYAERFDLEKIMTENEKNPKNLKGIAEKAEPEKIQEKLEKSKQQDKDGKVEEQIEQDLEQDEQDLDISYYRQITDRNFNEQIEMDLSGYKEIGMAYSKAQNSFIMIGKNSDGKFEKIEGFEKAQPTYKVVMGIDEEGKNVENRVPHALMKTSKENKEVSITIGQYGYIEVGTVDRLSNATRVERQVREKGEGENGRTNIQLNRAIRTEGVNSIYNWSDKNIKRNETNLPIEQGKERDGDIAKEITGENKDAISNAVRDVLEEYGVTEIGNDKLKIAEPEDLENYIEEEADRVKVSKEGFKRYIKNAAGKTLNEKINNAQDEIVQEYIGEQRRK